MQVKIQTPKLFWAFFIHLSLRGTKQSLVAFQSKDGIFKEQQDLWFLENTVPLFISIFFLCLRKFRTRQRHVPTKEKRISIAIGAKFYFSVFDSLLLATPSKILKIFATLDCFVPRNDRGIFESVLSFENNRRSLRSRQKPRKFLKKV